MSDAVNAAADIYYGVECDHHYGITIRPCEAGIDIAAVAYNEMRETHTFLTDSNHEWSVEWSDAGRWHSIVVRKNENSGYWAFNPWRIPDGPGVVWFRHRFRSTSRLRVNAEAAELLAHSARCREEALRNRDSKAGRKRYAKRIAIAEDYERMARLTMKRWPHHVGFLVGETA